MIIKALGTYVFSFLFDSSSNIGNANAAVLPVPLCATPRISNFLRIIGMAFLCITVGLIYFKSSSA